MIDSHVHLNLKDYEDDFENALARAVMDGVGGFMNIGYDPGTARATVDLVEKYPFIFGVVGTHPHDATVLDDAYEADLRRYLEHPRIVGVGEIGLDYYRNHSPQDVQRSAFVRMLRLALEKNLPVVIHCRDAFDDVLEVLAAEAPRYRGIFHAFSGGPDAARRVIDLGFHIGVGGVSTFRNTDLSATIAEVPLDRIVMETDSPYLTPAPYRGQRNEPAYVMHVAATVAAARKITIEEVDRATTANFSAAMGIAPEALPQPVYRIGASVYIYAAAAGMDTLERFSDIEGVDELVVCGMGEPLAQLERVKEAASWAKAKDWWVRINTLGQGNHIAGRDIVPELSEVADEVVVQLYGTSANYHDRMALEPLGEEGFQSSCEFVRGAAKTNMDTICEFIATPRFKADPCRELAKSLGAKYDIRMFRS